MKLAVGQYSVEFLRSFEGWADKQAEWVALARSQRADLLVFPEYASSELLGVVAAQDASLFAQVTRMQELIPAMKAQFQLLSRLHGVYILAGSNLEFVSGQLRNRAWLFAPDGTRLFVDKCMPTPTEREWGIQAGDATTVFDTPFGRMGVLVCYDAEFPLLARGLVEQGVELILVPSCTDSVAGYHRVRIACQARALESQCYVAQAVTVGQVPGSPLIDENVGAAGVYVTPDRGLPPDGVVAQGSLNQAGWVYAELDFKNLVTARAQGQVEGRRDWQRPEHLETQAQLRAFLPIVT
jgi:predicted amidohydrolase